MKMNRLYGRMGIRLRTSALQLQGLMVKLGQFMSTRTDILPTLFTNELRTLQDAVPPVPFEQIKSVIEAELGSHLEANFSHFEHQALAAASFGQVHLATLRQGGLVAVKTLKPDVEQLAEIDLRALKVVVRFLQRFTKVGRRLQVMALYGEFESTIYEELDYQTEARHLHRFQKQFATRNEVVVPRVFEEYSARRVLVMEYIKGVKITDLVGLKEIGVKPADVVSTLVDTYLEQVLVHGFIHVDPHPGNLLVLSDGKLGFLDFGMMSEIPRTEATTFARLLLAVMVRDVDTVISCMRELGFLETYADTAFLRRAGLYLIDQMFGLEWKPGPEFEAFIEEFLAFLRSGPLHLPARYMFLGRAISMILGLVNSLEPNIQWTSLLRQRALPKLTAIVDDATKSTDGQSLPWQTGLLQTIQSLFGDNAATVSRVALGQIQAVLTTTLRLPVKVERVLDKIDSNELEIKLELSELYFRLERQQRSVSRLVWFVVGVILTLVVVWLHSLSLQHLFWQATILDGLVGLYWLWIMRPKRQTAPRRLFK
jgi:predicted unusual protein kinase regulating ubiquinone biosynthesis (AarF/ABC1/UbiB family)